MPAHETSPHESKVYYQFSKWYESVFARFFGPGMRIMLNSLELPEGSQVLEVGVGTGLSLDVYPQHVHLTGIDLSGDMLAQAQQKVDDNDWSHISLREMNALEMEFDDEQFDLVTCFHVVTVVPDHRRLMEEMVRVCKPGGQLVIVNHFQSPRRAVSFFVDRIEPVTRHLGWQTRLSVEQLIADLPLEIRDRRKTSSLFTGIVAKKMT